MCLSLLEGALVWYRERLQDLVQVGVFVHVLPLSEETTCIVMVSAR